MDANQWAAAIGRNVAALRKAKDMTQARMGELAGMTVPGVSRLESGEHLPSLKTLLRVAEALGVGPCKLLEDGPPAGPVEKKGKP